MKKTCGKQDQKLAEQGKELTMFEKTNTEDSRERRFGEDTGRKYTGPLWWSEESRFRRTREEKLQHDTEFLKNRPYDSDQTE
ncbi:hypothetical protein E2C01_045329 [Portunus trituberculatus]|uniref:Uncharacterized protein n=1 Tax=Portunus trituberculatus TaxID=210409 RepID=A0A5B7G2K4_PORTR|nr:hypothetical protein [Portunus trituberculatus]